MIAYQHLYSRTWRPSGDIRGVLAIVHGVGEHSGRYSSIVDHLTSRGFAVTAFDLRGHGRSPGRRGHIGSWSDYRGDVRAFVRYSRDQFPGIPVFLYGHSLGALIVSDYVIFHPEGLAGVIVSGHPLRPTGAAKPHLILIARILSRLWPTFSIPLGLDKSALSRDPAVVRAYAEDPLVHTKVSARWGMEALQAVDRVRARAKEITLPILLIHGGADRINSVEGSQELLELVSSEDKQIDVYPGGAHEPHNDLESAEMVRDLERWLSRRVPGRTTSRADAVEWLQDIP